MSLFSLFGMALRALIFGFFGAAMAYFVLREAMRFRADWSKVLPAALLANFVCAISETATMGFFDPRDPDFLLKFLGLVSMVGFVFAILASRVSIKSESGRALPWLPSLVSGLCLVGPAVGLSILVVTAFSSFD